MKVEFKFPPDIHVTYIDEPEAAASLQQSGSCIITRMDSDISGAASYIEKEEDLKELSEDYIRRVYDRFVGRPHVLGEVPAGGFMCTVRELKQDDYPEWLELMSQSGEFIGVDGEYERFLNMQREYRKASEEEKKILSRMFGVSMMNEYKLCDFGEWAICTQGKLIGSVKFSGELDGVCIGYALCKEYRGMHIMGEVLDFTVRYGMEELGIERFTISVREENKASMAVAKRLQKRFERNVEVRVL